MADIQSQINTIVTDALKEARANTMAEFKAFLETKTNVNIDHTVLSTLITAFLGTTKTNIKKPVSTATLYTNYLVSEKSLKEQLHAFANTLPRPPRMGFDKRPPTIKAQIKRAAMVMWSQLPTDTIHKLEEAHKQNPDITGKELYALTKTTAA
jgi:hypothetical protein